jgi:TetR/AcrR family transcriptional repressor of lmrAB and yxaGH operons
MVETGLNLLQKQGYAETSWRELVKEGGTPWGSIQHFFPGGKEELATEALSLFGATFKEFFDDICSKYSRPSDRVRVWFESMAVTAAEKSYSNGCPVAGIAVNSVPMVESLTILCRESISLLIDYVTQKLVTDRIDATTAHALATRVLICFEGTLILARIYQSADSFHIAAEWLAQMLDEADRRGETGTASESDCPQDGTASPD